MEKQIKHIVIDLEAVADETESLKARTLIREAIAKLNLATWDVDNSDN